MSLHDHKPDAWHRSLGEEALPEAHDPATRRALGHAAQLAREYHDQGRLLDPYEALAVACKDGHSSETLYSLACRTAATVGGDFPTILKHLEHDWPDFT